MAGPSDGAGTGGVCDAGKEGSLLPGTRRARGVGAGWRGAGTPKPAGAHLGTEPKPTRSCLDWEQMGR